MWARRNEDQIPPSDCNYNLIHLIEDISEESGSAGEPVTLQEVKDYLRLEGFTSGDDFDFDDDLIETLIIEARMYVEKITGIHLVNKHLHVVASNGEGMIELPGPVTGGITGLDEDGNALGPDFKTIGQFFVKVKTPNLPMMDFTYWGGYSGNAPAWAKGAIKAYVADHYEYRGDDAPPAANQRCAQKCRPHGRLSQWG